MVWLGNFWMTCYCRFDASDPHILRVCNLFYTVAAASSQGITTQGDCDAVYELVEANLSSPQAVVSEEIQYCSSHGVGDCGHLSFSLSLIFSIFIFRSYTGQL